MSPVLYGGIDAGGTSTRCLVADRHGRVQGIGHGGPGNSLLCGEDTALRSMTGAVKDAVPEMAAGELQYLHIAAAGTVVPAGSERLARRVTAGNDAPAALIGALVEDPGAIVIAGTGSACCGQDGKGRIVVEGGWGPLAGDEGSGYAIGREALRLLARAMDGREPEGPLLIALRGRFATSDRAAFQASVYSPPLPRDQVAAISDLVAGAARVGDRAAKDILGQAGRDLAGAVADLLGHLGLGGREASVAVRGGVWQAGPSILTPFTRSLNQRAPSARVVAARFPAMAGALLLAYRHEGIRLEPELLVNLERDLAARGVG
ncbi:MAG TPA: BadF/BadG/BcrA/BcrD ATPase family protein [Chloroflexota bacterium]|nr:BadF/BadG/BcrA/BcrD ATPase family protein [Chloroflexota bacterium]